MSKDIVIPEVVKPGRGRPSKALSITGQKSLQDRATAIHDHHNRAREHAAMAAYYMVLCGFELLAVQSTLGHGEWEPWVEANCPFKRITAWKYMETAKRIPGNQMFTVVNICQSGKSLLSLPAPQREKAIAAIKRATDGRTITQLYLDLDIVKPQRTYEHIGGNAELRAWLAEHHPECKARRVSDLPAAIKAEFAEFCGVQAAEKAKAAAGGPSKDELAITHYRLTWDELIKGLREYVMQQHGHVHVAPRILEAGIESLGDCLRKLREDFKNMHG